MRPLLSILVLAVLGGCITPSIPIPPPDPGRMTFAVTITDTSSTATFAYPPDVNYVDSIVFVFNRERRVGVIEAARADGSVGPTAPLAAALGEQIVVTFQREDQTVSTCIRLREGAQSATDFCGP
ncbi:MAG TPA: hypothetical protein VNO30_29185 [Kofleriaceae bacterium]|nr:hypothetical protein [Kofleriaceae bacterium]